jgi:hypothetical protein
MPEIVESRAANELKWISSADIVVIPVYVLHTYLLKRLMLGL